MNDGYLTEKVRAEKGDIVSESESKRRIYFREPEQVKAFADAWNRFNEHETDHIIEFNYNDFERQLAVIEIFELVETVYPDIDWAEWEFDIGEDGVPYIERIDVENES